MLFKFLIIILILFILCLCNYHQNITISCNKIAHKILRLKVIQKILSLLIKRSRRLFVASFVINIFRQAAYNKVESSISRKRGAESDTFLKWLWKLPKTIKSTFGERKLEKPQRGKSGLLRRNDPALKVVT